MSYTAGDVMDLAAAALNDADKELYSYARQLPFLKAASDDLDLEFAAYGLETHKSKCDIDVDAGDVELTLPCNFFMPIKLQERLKTSTNEDDFVDMTERVFEPSTTPGVSLDYWAFRKGLIKFVGANTNRTVRLFYYQMLRTNNDPGIVQSIGLAKNFLAFKTASYCAGSIGASVSEYERLGIIAAQTLDTLITNYVKNSQGTRSRRKPFRIWPLSRPFRIYG